MYLLLYNMYDVFILIPVCTMYTANTCYCKNLYFLLQGGGIKLSYSLIKRLVENVKTVLKLWGKGLGNMFSVNMT